MNTWLILLAFLSFGSVIGIIYIIVDFTIKTDNYNYFQDCTKLYNVNDNIYRSSFETFKERYDSASMQKNADIWLSKYQLRINNDRYIFKTFKDYCKYLKWLEKETYKENNKKQIEVESKIKEL